MNYLFFGFSKRLEKRDDITGKSMNGWIIINESDLTSDKNFKKWVSLGIEFAQNLSTK